MKQVEIAALFKRSQNWVSVCQRRQRDPMPREGLEAILAWGTRNGLAGNAAAAEPAVDVETALKEKRHEDLQIQLDQAEGRLVSREEHEHRQVQWARAFSREFCDFPRKARAVLERHLEPGTVAAIYAELEKLPEQLLNEDPVEQLRGLPIEEARRRLLARVEEVLACLPA